MTATLSLNVYLIDRDQKFSRLLLAALEPYSIRIIQSATLREAEMELFALQPDLIIMDSMQSDGDALEWLKTRRSGGMDVPVLFLSTTCHSTEYFCRLVNMPGVSAVLHKPLTQTVLSQVLKEQLSCLLERSSSGSLAATASSTLAESRPAANPAGAAPSEARSTGLAANSGTTGRGSIASSAPGNAAMDEIERELRELSLEYIRELPDRFKALIKQVDELKMGQGDSFAAKNEAHKIKGTAASYGAHEVGKQAVIIDDCLKRIAAQKAGENQLELWFKLDEALAEALRLSVKASNEADGSAEAPAPVLASGTAALAAAATKPAEAASGRTDDAEPVAAVRERFLCRGAGPTIVIVDDDEEFTRRISLVLGYEDMLVYSFNDARHIIEVLEILHPDLLILDLNMPDLDGFEVCKRIRQEPRFQHLPIVFLTAQSGWETRVEAFAAGADDYIPKPVVNQELIARVRVRVEKSRMQELISSQSSVNKLLWQALFLLLLDQKLTGSA